MNRIRKPFLIPKPLFLHRTKRELVPLLCLFVLSGTVMAQDLPTRQTPWRASKVVGSPDPPLPYTTTRVFPNVELKNPTDAVWAKEANKWIVAQSGGRLGIFDNDPADATTELLLDLNDLLPDRVGQAYGVILHPDQANQPWCFVTFVAKPQNPEGVHLARLRVLDPTIPTFDESSLTVLARWSSHGHMGASMQFGPDGMLYVSVGDGQRPYPPDDNNTGQDNSDFQATVLRIDVNNPTPQQPYRVPADNPFVGQANVRPEIWAYGFRNPWKIAFDPATGDLFAADVGWEMREMIYRVLPGRNFGWSIMEGSQPVKQDLQPTIPITPPLFEHTHVDSRSITGGHFWHSDRIPELKGAYIYGDWMTGKVWALKHEGDRVLWQKELVDTPLQIISFLLDPTGEVMILAYDGTILRLDPNPKVASEASFPQRLTDTGLFDDVVNLRPAPGVVEYEINAHHWADGTQSRQWIAIPGSNQLSLYKKDEWQTGNTAGRFDFPQDTVLAKTISYLTNAEDPQSEQRIETQLLHRTDGDWRAYNYIWNDSQTDAVLQDDVAIERKLTTQDRLAPGGSRSQTWRHASRSECLLCHIWAAGSVHAFWPEQLNLDFDQENQIDRLTRLGLFQEEVPKKPAVASPNDESLSLESRARSYLALNCSTCHRPQGGGTANFNFDWTKSLEENNYLDALPAQGSFQIENARVVAPGDPFRSVLLYRTLKSGRGHMPQFGSNVIDMQGISVLHDWIASMDREDQHSESMPDLPTLLGSDNVDQELHALLATTSGAMALSLAVADQSIDQTAKQKLIEAGNAHEDPLVRDLFQHYLPEDKRIKRLGPTIDVDALLAQEGSAERGKQLFENAKDVNCRSCHRIGTVGQAIGPDLDGIGLQQTSAEILASILNPSAVIDAKYRTRQVLTVDGTALVGIVVSETADELTIADASGKKHVISAEDIDLMQPASRSVMPDQLLAGMTSQQAADLLAYLSAQRKPGPLHHKQAIVTRTSSRIVIDGKSDEADWKRATSVGDFVFTWWNQGDGEPQQTDARLLWDDENLYVSFQCQDKDVQAVHTERDSPVYRDDCVEVFASPVVDHPERYFNIEMNALGTQLEQYRPSGDPNQKEWNPDGIRVAVSIDGTLNDSSDTDRGWTLEVAIPFQLFKDAIPNGKPNIGDRWRMNLNRLEGNMKVKSQWSQGDRNFPRFHHPEFFGTVLFAE